ncbi:MAG: NAD(P)-dependent oxidoreductase [Planctomycetota bacterium]
MEGKKVLVTGCTGTIGCPLTLHLAEAGNEVHGVSTMRTESAREKLDAADIPLWKKDLTCDPLDDMPDDFEFVFHECVEWGHYDEDTTEDKELVYWTNPAAVGRVMLRWPKAKYVLGSTGGLYAWSAVPLDETAPTVVKGTYHSGKFAMEQMGKFLSVEFDIPATILRYYWPRSSFEAVAAEMVRAVLEGTPVKESVHDPWTYTPLDMRDICYYTERAVEAAGIPPTLLNCGGPEVVSKKELLEIAGQVLGKEPVIADREPRVKRAVSDSSKLYGLYGEPTHRITEYVRRLAEEVKAKGPEVLGEGAGDINWGDSGADRK